MQPEYNALAVLQCRAVYFDLLVRIAVYILIISCRFMLASGYICHLINVNFMWIEYHMTYNPFLKILYL